MSIYVYICLYIINTDIKYSRYTFQFSQQSQQKSHEILEFDPFFVFFHIFHIFHIFPGPMFSPRGSPRFSPRDRRVLGRPRSSRPFRRIPWIRMSWTMCQGRRRKLNWEKHQVEDIQPLYHPYIYIHCIYIYTYIYIYIYTYIYIYCIYIYVYMYTCILEKAQIK